MGEVVVSSEDELEIMEIVKEEELKKKKDFKEGSSSTMARLENVLPKLGLRILLVEDDDSTRQLIAALLRKCSYKGKISFHFGEIFPFFLFLELNLFFCCVYLNDKSEFQFGWFFYYLNLL